MFTNTQKRCLLRKRKQALLERLQWQKGETVIPEDASGMLTPTATPTVNHLQHALKASPAPDRTTIRRNVLSSGDEGKQAPEKSAANTSKTKDAEEVNKYHLFIGKLSTKQRKRILQPKSEQAVLAAMQKQNPGKASPKVKQRTKKVAPVAGGESQAGPPGTQITTGGAGLENLKSKQQLKERLPPASDPRQIRAPAPATAMQETAAPTVSRPQWGRETAQSVGQSDTANCTGEAVEVTSSSAVWVVPLLPDLLADRSPILWHKVTVKTPIIDREVVIAAINHQLSPLKVIPYFFRREDGCITFLVNDCSDALCTLISTGLKIPFGFGSFDEIELTVVLRYMKMDISLQLRKILMKRLDPEKKFVDLSYLNTIPEFQEMVYDPSDISHLLQQLVAMIPAVAPDAVSLSVAGNELTSQCVLDSVIKNTAVCKSLEVLDVTHNKIQSIVQMVSSHRVPLLELYVHQNPVCGLYTDAASYIRLMKVNFPRLHKLDWTYLNCTPGLPCWKQNYIYCGSGDDPSELADQFAEHFFTLFDRQDRGCLRRLYHRDALFSVSCVYLPWQSTSSNARLTSYMTEQRNLLRLTNKAKAGEALSRGAESVLAKLARLPRTQHDPHSLTVDVLCNTGSSAVLTVTGVFRESSSVHAISPRHFMRTFVLVAVANKEYQIVNDILFVTNATTMEAKEAFRYTRPHEKVGKCKAAGPLTKNSEESMVSDVSQITGMTTEWSRKCLSDCDWDVKEALEVFVELYKVKQIPGEAFKSHAVRQETIV